MKHIKVTKEGVAFFELDLDLKDPESNIYLYKVRLEGPPKGEGSGRVCRCCGQEWWVS